MTFLHLFEGRNGSMQHHHLFRVPTHRLTRKGDRG
ncbi:MAG: hypothetical protein NBKEAIPA_00082 [Nitrospirae bacterium]|nr:hypothetical protein [Nitrospirota bacterium]